MTAELIALTEELRRTTEMLAAVIIRLDEADQRANRHRLWTLLLALSVMAVTALGGFFVVDSRHERDRICEAVRGGFAQYTEALIAASERTPEPRTPEEQERRDEAIRDFRREIAARLETCG